MPAFALGHPLEIIEKSASDSRQPPCRAKTGGKRRRTARPGKCGGLSGGMPACRCRRLLTALKACPANFRLPCPGLLGRLPGKTPSPAAPAQAAFPGRLPLPPRPARGYSRRQKPRKTGSGLPGTGARRPEARARPPPDFPEGIQIRRIRAPPGNGSVLKKNPPPPEVPPRPLSGGRFQRVQKVFSGPGLRKCSWKARKRLLPAAGASGFSESKSLPGKDSGEKRPCRGLPSASAGKPALAQGLLKFP